jgi:Holliday junction resolvase
VNRPSSTAYRRGRDLECRVRKDLEARGYVVVRSHRSLSPTDLWAAKVNEPLLFIQVKRDLQSLGARDWNALRALALQGGALPVIATAPYGEALRYYVITNWREPRSRIRPMQRMFLEDDNASAEAG